MTPRPTASTGGHWNCAMRAASREPASKHAGGRHGEASGKTMTEKPAARDLGRITLSVLAIGLMILASLWVLSPFLGAGVWAAMIVVATWPMMLAVRARFGGRRWVAVTVMTM